MCFNNFIKGTMMTFSNDSSNNLYHSYRSSADLIQLIEITAEYCPPTD